MKILELLKKKSKNRNKELDAALQKIQNNMENNYKDAAQINLKEFEELFQKMKQSGTLKEEQIVCYEQELADLHQKMKNFTHQDQKPYWT